MHAKTVVAVCGRIITPERAARIFGAMDVELTVISAAAPAPSAPHRPDLVLFDDSATASVSVSDVEGRLARVRTPEPPALFVAVSLERLASFCRPTLVASDFAVDGALDAEISLRCHQLLWPGQAACDADFVQVGSLTVNLATYQVKVNASPVDLTFMEYSLLSFLVTHPGRIYSREVLLSQVWGFDYYGGSRTVDVHVRRLRAKLGPEAAQHLETVRGAGYLWSN